ncbi:hypothetical protein [Pseudoduganella sp. HUAS MS19]
MTSFEKQYYFLKRGDHETLPYPTAFHETCEREYWKAPLLTGSAPLAFYNGEKRDNRNEGIEPLPAPPDVMFERGNIIVRNHVRDALLERKVAGLFMHPVWWVHEDKSLHDDFCYIGFREKFDCWDRELSEHSGQDEDADPDDLEPSVWSFRLNAKLLEQTPLNERLLFVMGGCFTRHLVCHESILPLFNGGENSGTHATLVADY